MLAMIMTNTVSRDRAAATGTVTSQQRRLWQPATRSLFCHSATITLAALSLSAVFVGHAQEANAKGVVWAEGPLTSSLDAARRSGKLVVVDVFAEWCGPCHKYDREVFSRDDVAQTLSGAVPFRIDGETDAGKKLVERYHVVGFPTILFLKGDGTEVDRITGYLEPETFKEVASGYLTGKGTLAELQKQLAKTPNDHKLRFDVGKRLTMKGELDQAIATFAPLLDKKAKFKDRAEIHFTLGKYGYLRGAKRYDDAIRELNIVLKRYPASKSAGSAHYPLARAWHKKGNSARALATFDQWIKLKPKDVGRYNAVAWFCFKNKVEMKRGIAYARKGLAIDDKASYLWDTLAELHFATGNKAAAITAIKRAIDAAPKDAYYKKQLKKFQKG